MKVTHIADNVTEVYSTTFNIKILFSYGTPVAYKRDEETNVWVSDKFFSKTTSRHVNTWKGSQKSLKIAHSEIEAMVESF